MLLLLIFLPTKNYGQSNPPGETCTNPLEIELDTVIQSLSIDMTGLSNYYVTFNASSSDSYFYIQTGKEFPVQLNLYQQDCTGGVVSVANLETDSNGVKSIDLYATNLDTSLSYVLEIVQNAQSTVTDFSLNYFDFNLDYNLDTTNGGCYQYVKNGYFEDSYTLPVNGNLDKRIFFCKGWLNNSISNPFYPDPSNADYYNPNGNTDFSPPSTQVGYLVPHSGNSYAGLFTIKTRDEKPDYLVSNAREWMTTKLKKPLTAGSRYLVTMYVSLANGTGYDSPSAPPGAYFTTTATSSFSNVAHFQSTQIISTSGSWIKITGSFVAIGGEKYVTIGNFLSNYQTVPNANYGKRNVSYFLVDDVSVDDFDKCCSALAIQDGWDVNDVLTSPNLAPFVDAYAHTINNVALHVYGTFTIDDNFSIENSTFIMEKDAKIEVVNGKPLTVSNSEFKVCGNDMWDGFEVNYGSQLSLYSSSVWDAKKGVNSLNGGEFTIWDCDFNSNRYGVYVDEYGNKHNGSISATTFESTHNLLNPFAINRAFAGIYINEVNNYNGAGQLKIGDPLYATNEFYGPAIGDVSLGLRYGIYSNYSSFKVVNSTFESFNQLTINDTQDKSGIKVLGVPSKYYYPLDYCPTAEVGNMSLTSTTQNKFLNSTSAVNVTDRENVHIVNNKIEYTNNTTASDQINYAIDIQDLVEIVEDCEVSNNSIKGVVNGIRLKNFDDVNGIAPNEAVSNNTIELMDLIGNTGIYYYEVEKEDFNRIDSNTITKAARGIQIDFGTIPLVEGNDVTINTTNTSGMSNFAIRLNNALSSAAFGQYGTDEKIAFNKMNVIPATNNTDVFGFGMYHGNYYGAGGTPILCNEVNNMGTGLYFNDIYNSGTSDIFANAMEDNYNSFVIRNNARLYDIGSTSQYSDNTFVNSGNYDTYAVPPTDGSFTTLFTRIGLPYEPMVNAGSPPISKNPNSTGSSYVCNSSSNSSEKSNTFANKTTIIRTTVPSFDSKYTSDTLRWMAKYQYYRNILNDSIVNSAVQHFRDSVDGAPLGEMMAIEKQINSSKVNQKLSSLSAVQSTVPQENLLKTVIQQKQLEKSQKWDTLPNNAKTVLEPIAKACPMDAGPAVYKARAILYQYTGKRYHNLCESYTSSIIKEKRLKAIEETTETLDGIAVYPNPTNNLLNIELKLDKQQEATFKVFDLSGRLLLNEVLTNGKNNIPLKKLRKGMYIYRIQNQKGEILKTDKLIIQ